MKSRTRRNPCVLSKYANNVLFTTKFRTLKLECPYIVLAYYWIVCSFASDGEEMSGGGKGHYCWKQCSVLYRGFTKAPTDGISLTSCSQFWKKKVYTIENQKHWTGKSQNQNYRRKGEIKLRKTFFSQHLRGGASFTTFVIYFVEISGLEDSNFSTFRLHHTLLRSQQRQLFSWKPNPFL